MNSLTQRNAFFATPAIALYVFACAMPAASFLNTNTHAQDTFSGGQALLLGPLTILAGQLGWLANPIWAAALITLLWGRHRTAAALAGLAAVIATHTLALKGHPLPANEGGQGELQLRGFGPGFSLWIASLLALLGGAVLRAVTDQTSPAKKA